MRDEVKIHARERPLVGDIHQQPAKREFIQIPSSGARELKYRPCKRPQFPRIVSTFPRTKQLNRQIFATGFFVCPCWLLPLPVTQFDEALDRGANQGGGTVMITGLSYAWFVPYRRDVKTADSSSRLSRPSDFWPFF